MKYGDNSYYWYKTLGELTPDILTIIVPELATSKAAKVSKAGTVVIEVSEDVLQKSGKVLSEKLEQTTAKKEIKEAFKKAEKEIDEKVNKANFPPLARASRSCPLIYITTQIYYPHNQIYYVLI